VHLRIGFGYSALSVPGLPNRSVVEWVVDGRKKINFSTVFAGQAVGIKEVQNDIWLVSFMDYDLGYFALETRCSNSNLILAKEGVEHRATLTLTRLAKGSRLTGNGSLSKVEARVSVPIASWHSSRQRP
jgi:hypothetical protein